MNFNNYAMALSQNEGFEIPEKILQEWQNILNLLARIEKVKAALIMRIYGRELEVFMSSDTQGNPYKMGHKVCYMDSGLYCEQVITQGKMLLVSDATKSDEWYNNPDMEYNMKCYMGFPIKMPNGDCFGTICVLDNKQNDFSQDMKDCMAKMRDLIEYNLLLMHLSITDHLTGIYNRTYFNDKIEKEAKNAEQNNQAIASMMLDIDHFKTINDTYGHLAGDEVLIKCAEVIKKSLRNRDIAFRLGGDEFYVLMPYTTVDGAFEIAERLRANIEVSGIGQDIPVTVSIGVAERISGESSEQWFKRLDQALYKAKNKSGNRIEE